MLEPEEIQVTEYLLSASQGNLEDFIEKIKGVPHVDVTNKRDWTALMFAAKNGHFAIVKELLKRGCSILKTNSNGQTAKDLADFWQHKDISRILSTSSKSTNAPGLNYLCQNPIDRAAYRRTDSVWLESALKHPKSVFIVFSKLAPLVYLDDPNVLPSENKPFDIIYKLARFDYANVLRLGGPLEESLFLGVETTETSGYDSQDISHGWFSIETKLDFKDITEIISDVIVLPLYAGLLQLIKPEAAIVSQARSLLAWHDRNQFCPTCGHPSQACDAGYKRKCSNDDCRSNKGIHNTCYPRTDPSIIVAISSPDNKYILLGQNIHRHSKTMWSVLAGFIEPGENIEEACRREVYEETKIQVGPVRYHSSQPWPMPSSLMIGCHGHALSEVIEADKTEITRAKWFDGTEVQQMFAGQHPSGFTLPPVQTIAHQLILHWLKSIRIQEPGNKH